MTVPWRPLLAHLRQHPRLTVAVLLGFLLLLGWGGYRGGRHLWAWRHYQAAQRALERRDLAQAQLHLEACLQFWSKSSATHFLAARTARRFGSLTTAEEYLDRCERLQGGPSEATKLERALLHVQRGGLADQENYLRSYLEQDHADALAILEVVTTALMKQQRFVDTEPYLDRWVQLRPDDYEGLVRRAFVHEKMLDYAAAIRDYRQALARAPAQDQVRLVLAELLVHTSQAAEALEHFEHLRQRQPDHPAVLYGLARCQRQLGQAEEARQLLDTLLAGHPQDRQALSERGRLALEMRQPAEAEVFLRRAEAVDPYDLQIVHNLFQCLIQLGKKAEAEQYAARAQRIDADLLRASHLAEQIQTTAPHDPALRSELGTLLLRNGYHKDGLHWLATALQEDPRHPPTHQALAEFYERAGQRDLAARHRRLLQQPPGDRAVRSPAAGKEP